MSLSPLPPNFNLFKLNVASLPYVGAVKSTWPNGTQTGATGTLIAPRVILTAAHVVHDRHRGVGDGPKDSFASVVDLTFGGTVSRQANKYFTTSQWVESYSGLPVTDPVRSLSPYDYAVIVLEKPIDTLVRPARPPETTPDAFLASLSLQAVGYPAGYQGIPFGQLWGGASVPSSVTDFRIGYPMTTLGGMSGGPVYDFDQASNQLTIRGIHTSAPFADGFGNALRITSEVHDWIFDRLKESRPN